MFDNHRNMRKVKSKSILKNALKVVMSEIYYKHSLMGVLFFVSYSDLQMTNDWTTHRDSDSIS